MSSIQIGVDLMGSETSPLELFEAVRLALQEFNDLNFSVFMTKEAFQGLSTDLIHHDRLHFHLAEQVVEMDDDPLVAIRQKKQSSLVAGLLSLKKKQLNAFVTAGNTGALIAGAALFLPRIPGIKRPALLATLPTKNGLVSVIDVGGTVASRADRLLECARMGVDYQRTHFGVPIPKVGLLNIGVESKKGTAEIQKAHNLLTLDQEMGIEFVGNVEGREVFEGRVNVLVTDGFSGNIFLKTSEGVYSFIIDQLKHVLGSLLIEQREIVYQALRSQFDYEEYMGALVAGVQGIAVKCHGKSSSKALLNGIRGAIKLARART